MTIWAWFDASTGYKLELVIKAEGTIRNTAAVSVRFLQLFFKAALFSGLPIVERSPHSYAVSYYAQIDGYGLDSTIYPGVRDLKFTNDTPGYILIQTVVDGDDAYVTFSVPVTGEKSGWKIIGEAITARRRHRAYPDHDFAAGAKKQIESAHGGFDASWDRVITKGWQRDQRNIYSVTGPLPTAFWWRRSCRQALKIYFSPLICLSICAASALSGQCCRIVSSTCLAS